MGIGISLEDSVTHVKGRDIEIRDARKRGDRSFVDQRVGDGKEVVRVGEDRRGDALKRVFVNSAFLYALVDGGTVEYTIC